MFCYIKHSFRRIVHLLLAFMNSIQAIYNFQSLGRKVMTKGHTFIQVYVQVDFSIVNLEIQKTPAFNDHQGDREPMLRSFCDYQGNHQSQPSKYSCVNVVLFPRPHEPW